MYRFAKTTHIIIGVIMGLIGLLMAINNVIFAAGDQLPVIIWPKIFAVLVPLAAAAAGVVSAVKNENLQYSEKLRKAVRYAIFAAMAVNLGLLKAFPETADMMYVTLKNWIGLDVHALLGQNALWIIAVALVGIFLLYAFIDDIDRLGFPLALTRIICCALVVFVEIPILINLSWMQPPQDFPPLLFVLLSAVFYPLFWSFMSKDAGVVKTAVGLIIGGAALIGYWKLIYLVSGVLVPVWLFISIGWPLILTVIVGTYIVLNFRLPGGNAPGKPMTAEERKRMTKEAGRKAAQYERAESNRLATQRAEKERRELNQQNRQNHMNNY